jgi:FkbH-like protein
MPSADTLSCTREDAISAIDGKPVKVVVWDLDGTLWHGVLSENDDVQLRDGVISVLETLDGRGILNSISSRNDAEQALACLRRFGVDHFFLAPALNWGRKVEGIRSIAAALELGLDTFLFIDDQQFELDEVRFELPEVRTLHAKHIPHVTKVPALIPSRITLESATRRLLYMQEISRKTDEAAFRGSSDEFLATLGMVFAIRRAVPADLDRMAELIIRTNQLNANGRLYSLENLRALMDSPNDTVAVAELEDRYGSYGIVGLCLVATEPTAHIIKMILMSCRVLSRGVTGLMLSEMIAQARRAGATVWAEFVDTGRNRPIKIAFALAGFRPHRHDDGLVLLKHDGTQPGPVPSFVTIDVRL